MWIGVGLVALLLVYQLFFRYDYYHYGGNIARIDRLTGTLCALPCVSTPSPPTPIPTTADDYEKAVQETNDERFQQAISIAKSSPDVPQHDARYAWGSGGITKEEIESIFSSPKPLTGDLQNDTKHIFLVCLCDKHESGWRWEVNVETHRASFVNDNAALMQKYGIK